MKKLILLILGSIISATVAGQTLQRFFKAETVTELHPININITNGLTYTWFVSDQQDTVRYFNPNGSRYKATITFEEVVEVLPVTIMATSYTSSVGMERVTEGGFTFVRPVNGGIGGTLIYGDVNVDKKDQITLKYALAPGGVVGKVVIKVGGITVTSADLPTSTSWGTYRTFNMAIPAQSGSKEISLQVNRGLNLESITISKK